MIFTEVNYLKFCPFVSLGAIAYFGVLFSVEELSRVVGSSGPGRRQQERRSMFLV
jgi:hypothetical protein